MNAACVRSRGFTLIELMVVTAVLSIMAMLVWPVAEVADTRQRERELREALWQIREALDAYKKAVDQGQVASSNTSGYPPSLDVLVEGVPDAHASEGTMRYFLRRIPRDPFAPRDIPDQKTWGLRSFDSPADQPSEGSDVYDVHSRSDRVGTNGVPLRLW